MRLRVPKEEYDREIEELKKLKTEYSAKRKEYEAKWTRLRSIVYRIRYWERRIAELTSRYEELRRIGWVRLHAAERREYLRLRTTEIPRARAYWLSWDTERTKIINEINRERIELRALELKIHAAEEEIKKKITPVPIKEIIQVKLVIYTIVTGPAGRPYTKRFQCFYNIDALRETETGEIDYTAPLTQKQLRIITTDFYSRWNWMALPRGASKPEIAETGEFEIVEEPQGATIKEMSMRENEEETYRRKFTPHQVLYTPTDKEKETMKKYTTGEKKTPKQQKKEEEEKGG